MRSPAPISAWTSGGSAGWTLVAADRLIMATSAPVVERFAFWATRSASPGVSRWSVSVLRPPPVSSQSSPTSPDSAVVAVVAGEQVVAGATAEHVVAALAEQPVVG